MIHRVQEIQTVDTRGQRYSIEIEIEESMDVKIIRATR
jgi:hypothetical protein